MNADAQQQVAECFAVVFPERQPDEYASMRRGESGDWDSLAAITLITVSEETFGIVIDDEAVDDLTSFDSICATVAAAKP